MQAFCGKASTEVNETAEKLTHKNKADFNLELKSTLLFYKFYALIFAVDFRFSLCYHQPTEKAKIFFGEKEKLSLKSVEKKIHQNFTIIFNKRTRYLRFESIS